MVTLEEATSATAAMPYTGDDDGNDDLTAAFPDVPTVAAAAAANVDANASDCTLEAADTHAYADALGSTNANAKDYFASSSSSSSGPENMYANGAVNADYIPQTGRIRFRKDFDVSEETLAAAESLASASGMKALHLNESPYTDGASSLDIKRKKLAAYEYLCRIQEAKCWLEACLDIQLPPPIELAAAMQNGVILAKLAQLYEPDIVKRIFEATTLQFRHSDNINYFFDFCKKIGLPKLFLFSLTDLYNLKNFPSVVYCIHALSHILYKQGRAPRISAVKENVLFSDADVDAVQADIEEQGLTLPAFGSLGVALAREMAPVGIEQNVVKVQRAIRVFLERRRLERVVNEFRTHHLDKVDVIARATRVYLAQKQLHALREERRRRDAYFAANIEHLVRAQAATRMVFARRVLEAKRVRHAHFVAHEEKIVHLQTCMRAYVARRAYRQLVHDRMLLEREDGVTIPVLTKFFALFSTKDPERGSLEVEIEDLYARVMRLIRDNSELEMDLAYKDMKIELLVRNHLTINDYLKSGRRTKKDSDNSKSTETLLQSTAIFRHRPSNKNSRTLLENYQAFFYMLQTKPIYLARLLAALKKREIQSDYSSSSFSSSSASASAAAAATISRNSASTSASASASTAAESGPVVVSSNTAFGSISNSNSLTPHQLRYLINVCVLTFFAHSQSTREEYLQLRLFERVIEDVIVTTPSVDSLFASALSSNSLLIQMLNAFSRTPRIQSYARSVVERTVQAIAKLGSSPALETDPIKVYKLSIQEEESSTGVRSTKKYDTPLELVLQDEAVVQRTISNHTTLFNFLNQIYNSYVSSIRRMPYAIRYIVSHIRSVLSDLVIKNPHLASFFTPDITRRFLATALFEGFIAPAIRRPTEYGILQQAPPHSVTRTLEIAASHLCDIISNTEFSEAVIENFLPPWISTSRAEFGIFLNEVGKVAKLETQMHFDAFADAATRRRPTIFISPTDILLIHELFSRFRSDLALEAKENHASADTSPAGATSAAPSSAASAIETAQANHNSGKIEDPLVRILDLLGDIPSFDHEVVEPEIAFALSPCVSQATDPKQREAFELRRLFTMTKPEIIRLIQIHGNCDTIADLLAITPAPEDEVQFAQLYKDDQATSRLLEVLLGIRRHNNDEHQKPFLPANDAHDPIFFSDQQNQNIINSNSNNNNNNNNNDLGGDDNSLRLDSASNVASSSTSLTNHVTVTEFRVPMHMKDLAISVRAALDSTAIERVISTGHLSMEETKEVIRIVLEYLVMRGTISSDNGYAYIMRSIAHDFRKRYTRAEVLRSQHASLLATLQTLRQKQKYLMEQDKSFDDYIESCHDGITYRRRAQVSNVARRAMLAMSTGRSARRVKAVQKIQGRLPQHGAFCYSFKDLQERGVVVKVAESSAVKKGDIVLSSDKQGQIDLTGFDVFASVDSANIAMALEDATLTRTSSTQRPLQNVIIHDKTVIVQQYIMIDDILAYNYENKKELAIFGGALVFDLCKLLALINKKFFS